MHKFVRAFLPMLAFLGTVAVLPSQAVPVTIIYPDPAGQGFNDPTLGPARKAAFEAAANYVSQTLDGTVPLVITAEFTAQGGTANGAVLANAGPAGYSANWQNPSPPRPNTWYPSGLANQLAGRDLDPAAEDINAYFNSDVDLPVVLGNRSFYYGTDGNNGTDIDFYSVALHELGHGLGFLSNQAPSGSYYGDWPQPYDVFLKQGSTFLTSASAAQRQAASISGALFFDGPSTRASNGGNPSKIYAPNPYQSGSSVSHIDEATYRGLNELMTPASSEVTHQFGPIASGMFKDIGWNVAEPADPPQTGSTLTVNKLDEHNDGACSVSDCTLTEAISTANGLSGTQTINFDLGAGDKTIALANGLPAIVEPLVIDGPTDRRITVSGGLFYGATSALTVKNLTMTGDVDGNSIFSAVTNASVIVTNCTFTGHAGSAILSFAPGVSLNISNSTFANNTQSAIRTETWGSNSVTVTNCTFSGNSGIRGAAICLLNQSGTGTLNVSNSTFSGNNVTQYGGAIYANCVPPDAGDPPSALSVTLTGSTFNNNSADWGGAYLLWPEGGTSSSTVSNCTFSSNSAASYGGGIANISGVLGLDSVTFVGNQAGLGGAASSFNPGSSFTSRNSLYANNSSSDSTGSLYILGGSSSQGYNIFSDSPSGFTATGDRKNQSALAGTLGPLDNNGGPTRTHALLAGNPALNTGSTDLALDQRGVARPQGGADDSGAYEAAPVNTAPTISGISNRTIDEDSDTGDLGITIGDNETPAAGLTLSGSSSNLNVVANAGITFGGSGANRTVKVTPIANRDGVTTITLTVSDGSLTTSTTFQLTVQAVNDAPTISDITNKSTVQGVATGAIAFTVDDIDSNVPALTLSAASSNTALVPVANVVFGGSGANRTVNVTPAAGQSGTATITVTVTDGGGASASDSFVLTVAAAPSITSFTPGSGPAGTVVVITGTNFSGATNVRFNGVAAAYTVNSATQITATVPATATTGPISVVGPTGTGTSVTSFTVGTVDDTPPSVTVTAPVNDSFIN